MYTKDVVFNDFSECIPVRFNRITRTRSIDYNKTSGRKTYSNWEEYDPLFPITPTAGLFFSNIFAWGLRLQSNN